MNEPVQTTARIPPTPGPWTVERYRDTLEVWGHANCCETRIAQVALPLWGTETAHADARLIAAAPALLEACQAVSLRLTAWAEHHKHQSRERPDSATQEDFRLAQNYYALVEQLDRAAAQAAAIPGTEA